MLRAWAAHLERFYATYTNTFLSSNKLHEIDLLDPRLIASFDDNEAIRRRRLANDYADAWHKLDDAVTTFSGSFYDDMRKEQISPERTSAEAQALINFVQKPETASKMASLRKLCKAEEDVGRGYNYAVSAVFDYGRMVSRMPNPGPGFRKQMDDQLGKLKETELIASEIRHETLACLGN